MAITKQILKKIWTFLKMNYNNGEVLVLKMPAAPTKKLSVKKTFETSRRIQHLKKMRGREEVFFVFSLSCFFDQSRKKKKSKTADLQKVYIAPPSLLKKIEHFCFFVKIILLCINQQSLQYEVCVLVMGRFIINFGFTVFGT